MVKSQNAEVNTLKAAVYDMDSISQTGLAEVIGIAKLALAALKTPEAYLHPESIAQAFHAIWAITEQTQTCIGGYAEEVGCSFDDDEPTQRYKAHSAAIERRAKLMPEISTNAS